jgi:hypothetical protein
MKAILEMEAPESCRECKLKYKEGFTRCILTKSIVSRFENRCDPNCPLKIVGDNKEVLK